MRTKITDACGGYDGSSFLRSVEVYDANLDTWKQVAPMNVKRSRVALTANMGKLYGGYYYCHLCNYIVFILILSFILYTTAIGGYDGESNLSTVEVYDPQSDKWSFVSPMKFHGGGVGAAVLAK